MKRALFIFSRRGCILFHKRFGDGGQAATIIMATTLGGPAVTGESPDQASTSHHSVEEEIGRLRAERDGAYRYIREKLAQIRVAVNNAIPEVDDLADADLIANDHIGHLAASFETLLADLNKTNERLRLVHEDMRVVFDLVGEAIIVVDSELNIIAHNKLAYEHFGDGLDSIVYRRCREIVCKCEDGSHDCIVAACAASGARVQQQNVEIGARLYDVIGTPVFSPEGRLLHTVITYVDMTDHRKALEAVARSELRYRDLFENANDLIQVSDVDGRVLYANEAWKRAVGISDPAGVSLTRLFEPDRLEAFNRAVSAALSEKRGVRLETSTRDASGGPLLLDGNISCSPGESGKTLVRAILRDVTRQRRLEEEIAVAQRMDTVGQLAGGIAHDFNNVLTAILGNISLAKMYEAQGLSARDKLDKAENAVVRAKGLTRQLLTFATGGSPVKKELALGPFLTETVNFTLSGSNVACEFAFAEDLDTVEVDQGQIEQVIQNLVLNAAQAMPEGGTIRVEAKNARIAAERELALEPGSYVAISVTDSGVGIAPMYMEKIFDPFFTTKEEGKGLGLATAFSITRKHCGTITAKSALGLGSRFEVYLPSHRSLQEPQRENLTAPAGSLGSGRILVMDDEPEIRSILETLLSHLGFEVSLAESGGRAVELYEEGLREGRRYDLIIMDLTVPGGMGGDEAMKHILRLDPRAKAVVSSGYSSDPVMSDFAAHGFAGVAVKPYRFETLTTLLSNLLGTGE